MHGFCYLGLYLYVLIFAFPAFGRWSETSIRTWESFTETLERETSIRSSEDLFAAMPSELLSRYSLPWRSGGLEKYLVTAKTPRVILHGDSRPIQDADNPFVAFTHLSNNVELTFPSEKLFHPHIIEFQPAPGVRFRVDHNLRACFTCHTGSMTSPLFSPVAFRPNWHTYPGWNGVYGERREGRDPSEAEVAQFAEFVASNGGRGIYDLPALASRRMIDLSHMNALLSGRTSYWNAKRIVSHLKGFSDFDAFKPAIMAGASTQTNYLDFLPSSVVNSRGGKKMIHAVGDAILAMQKHTYAEYFHQLENNRVFPSPGIHISSEDRTQQTTGSFLTLYHFLTESKGLPFSNLSTIFAGDYGGTSPTVFDDPTFSTVTLIRTLLMQESIAKLPSDHPVLRKFYLLDGDGEYYPDLVTHLGMASHAAKLDPDSFLALSGLESPYLCARWIARARGVFRVSK